MAQSKYGIDAGPSQLPGFLRPLTPHPSDAGTLFGATDTPNPNRQPHQRISSSAIGESDPSMPPIGAGSTILNCKPVVPPESWFRKHKKIILPIILVLVVALLLFLGFYFVGRKSKKDDSTTTSSGTSGQQDFDDSANVVGTARKAGGAGKLAGSSRMASASASPTSAAALAGGNRPEDWQAALTKQASEIRFLTTQVSTQADRLVNLERLVTRKPTD